MKDTPFTNDTDEQVVMPISDEDVFGVPGITAETVMDDRCPFVRRKCMYWQDGDCQAGKCVMSGGMNCIGENVAG